MFESPALIDPQILAEAQKLFPNEQIFFTVKGSQTSNKKNIIKIAAGITSILIFIAIFGYISIFTHSTADIPVAKKYVLTTVSIFFLVVGLGFIIDGIMTYFKISETWFIGTEKHLARLEKKELISKTWKSFNNNITKKGTNENGTITIMPPSHSSDNNSFTMNGISNRDAVVEICSKCIINATKNPNTITLEEFQKNQTPNSLPK